MKSTQYTGVLFNKDKEVFTKFVVGSKVVNSKIEELVLLLGGQLVKQTKIANHYEIKGDRLNLMMI